MTRSSTTGCPICGPQPPCVGARAHALFASIRASRRSPRSLARLLGCTPGELPTADGWHMVFLLGRLSLEELRQLALHVGLSTDELISCVDFSRADEHPALALRRAQLGALVFGSLPTGLFPEELAHRMNCDLSVVYETIRDALEHQPDGIRLCITGDGRLVHRADEGCLDTLGPDPETLAEPGFRLESPQLAASLWQLCQDKSADGIPAQHVAALRAARLIVTDGRDTRPVADVAHSLQFY